MYISNGKEKGVSNLKTKACQNQEKSSCVRLHSKLVLVCLGILPLGTRQRERIAAEFGNRHDAVPRGCPKDRTQSFGLSFEIHPKCRVPNPFKLYCWIADEGSSLFLHIIFRLANASDS